MKQIKAKIISNSRIKPSYFKMVMRARTAGPGEPVRAGQFINVRVSERAGVLLRRPLSIYSACGKEHSIEVLYKVVGRGTEVLSRKAGGGELDIIAPLGNGYVLPKKSQPVILIGGGTGTASIHFLAETLIKAGFSDVKALIGARDRENVICENDFNKAGCEVQVATDDGSKGIRGYVSCLFESLAASAGPSMAVYACGPRPMLREVVRISRKFKVPCQVSLEEYMACGVGACMSCVVKTRKPSGGSSKQFVYKRVCSEGPVFDGSEIIWE